MLHETYQIAFDLAKNSIDLQSVDQATKFLIKLCLQDAELNNIIWRIQADERLVRHQCGGEPLSMTSPQAGPGHFNNHSCRREGIFQFIFIFIFIFLSKGSATAFEQRGMLAAKYLTTVRERKAEIQH